MKKLFAVALVLSTLGGCVVYPVRPYVAAPVVVYPHYYHY